MKRKEVKLNFESKRPEKKISDLLKRKRYGLSGDPLVIQDIYFHHLNKTTKWLMEPIFDVQSQGPWLRFRLSCWLRVLVYWFSKSTYDESRGEYLKMMAYKDNPTDHLNRTSKFSIPKWSDVVNQKRTKEGHGPTVLLSLWLNNYIL